MSGGVLQSSINQPTKPDNDEMKHGDPPPRADDGHHSRHHSWTTNVTPHRRLTETSLLFDAALAWLTTTATTTTENCTVVHMIRISPFSHSFFLMQPTE